MTTTESRIIYLDNAATTRMDDEVLHRMIPFFTDIYGNPSSAHRFGQDAKDAIASARQKIAQRLGCFPDEIIFTSSGTEANNLALWGLAWPQKSKGNHIITSQIEHASVLETCKVMEERGFHVAYLPVDRKGVISYQALQEAITPQTILISLQHGNNEIGTIQPLAELAACAKQRGIVFHTDIVQSFVKVPLDLTHIDACSLSAHKIHGPKGIGALYLRRGVLLAPQLFGGGQEQTYRSGTENVPGIVGFGEAVTRSYPTLRLQKLRASLIHNLLALPGVFLNGPEQGLPHLVNVSFAGIDAETLLEHLSHQGIMVSKGSACHAHELQPSHVLLALGLPHELALGTIRISISKHITEEELDCAVRTIRSCVSSLRSISRWKQ